MSVLAQIYKDSELLFENIMVYVTEDIDPRSTLKSWQGTFEISVSPHIELGGPYRLALEDGRVGKFNIVKIGISSKGRQIIHFDGFGPLE